MQDLPSLIKFLRKEIQKYSSISTRINALSILSGMGCGISYPNKTPAIKTGNGIFVYIILDPPWTMRNATSRAFRMALKYISMWFRT